MFDYLDDGFSTVDDGDDDDMGTLNKYDGSYSGKISPTKTSEMSDERIKEMFDQKLMDMLNKEQDTEFVMKDLYLTGAEGHISLFDQMLTEIVF